LVDFIKDESVTVGLSKPLKFPEKQMAWIKITLADNANVKLRVQK